MSNEPQEIPARPRRRPSRTAVLLVVAALGLLAMAGGGTGLALELTREPTEAEIEAAGAAELAARWKIRPAGEIFPRTIDYTIVRSEKPPAGLRRQARRIGIAPPAACSAALDPRAAEILNRNGCRTVLRATYADSSGTLLTTLGVAVLPSWERAEAAEVGFTSFGTTAKDDNGVRAVAFPETVAAGFTDARRQVRWSATNRSPYMFFHSSGWADARGVIAADERNEEFAHAKEIFYAVMAKFQAVDRPCEAEGVRC